MGRTKSAHVRLDTDDTLGESWNPIRGCARVSPGCDHCFSERIATTTCGPGQPYEGFATTDGWTGEVGLIPSKLDEPIRSKRPRKYDTCSMSDLFAEQLPVEALVQVFAVMALTARHSYLVQTKRAERMNGLMNDAAFALKVKIARQAFTRGQVPLTWTWPLPNVWLGTSVEDQQRADERVPALLSAPATLRFLTVEPMLGPVDLARWLPAGHHLGRDGDTGVDAAPPRVGWVIAGAETGIGARPIDLDWVRGVRDQCVAAGVPFFLKQLVEDGKKIPMPELDGRAWAQLPPAAGG